MWTSAFFGAKNFGFFEIYGVSAWTSGGGLSQCGHFANKGEVVNFSRFCEDFFCGRPLTEKKQASFAQSCRYYAGNRKNAYYRLSSQVLLHP